MTAAEDYLEELAAAVRVRGRARRRLLAECREHLVDAVEVHGHEEAVRRFGPAEELARSFDAEIAVRRGLRATVTSVVGVLAVGLSTWALVNAADPTPAAVPVWAVVFFAGAQTAAVSMLLAVLRAAALRHRPVTPADVALLCRRNITALLAAAMTLFAAGAAVPGQAPAWQLLVGPGIAVIAAAGVVRARSLARNLGGNTSWTVEDPLADLVAVIRREVGPSELPTAARLAVQLGPTTLLVPTVIVAATGAFLWDHLDHGTTTTSMAAAWIEAGLVVVGFLLLGPALGLRAGRRRRTATA